MDSLPSGGVQRPTDEAVERTLGVLRDLDRLRRVAGRLQDHHVVGFMQRSRHRDITEVTGRRDSDVLVAAEGVTKYVLNLAHRLGHDRRLSLLDLLRGPP